MHNHLGVTVVDCTMGYGEPRILHDYFQSPNIHCQISHICDEVLNYSYVEAARTPNPSQTSYY